MASPSSTPTRPIGGDSRTRAYTPTTPYGFSEEVALQQMPILHHEERDDESTLFIPDQFSQRHVHQRTASDASTMPLYDPFQSGNSDYQKFPSKDSPTLFPQGHPPQPRRKHPFLKNFEAPDWKLIIIHIMVCVLSYPVMFAFVIASQSRPLFWTRFAVAAGGWLVGFAMSLTLSAFATAIYEATTWATIIHLSNAPENPGMKLKDIAAQTDGPNSPWMVGKLLLDRLRNPGAKRSERQVYDRRTSWTLYIVFFLLLGAISSGFSFLLGRIVDMKTEIKNQRSEYNEISIKGDLSDGDLFRASQLKSEFDNFIFTWTLAPFAANEGLPPPVSFRFDGRNVYLAEASSSQFHQEGSGFGTFERETWAPTNESDIPTDMPDPTADVEPGSIIRHPRWGIRIQCSKIPTEYIIPPNNSQLSYVFLPRDTLRSLFEGFEMDFPTILTKPFVPSDAVDPVDILPSTLDLNSISLGRGFGNNGNAHSLFSSPITLGQEGTGWVTIETVLVRLNTQFTPNGTFPLTANISAPNSPGTFFNVGYDAAVCLELYEPWIVDTYNSTIGDPQTLRLVDKSASIQDTKSKEKRLGDKLTDTTIKRQLSSSLLSDVYIVAHQNSVNQILKDNGRDALYAPSQTVISFTDGYGAYGYTELSSQRFARARGLADATNVLPYFVGSGNSVARKYPDLVLASAIMDPLQMILTLAGVLVAGVLAGLFVPRLPMSVPRRGFDVYSWFTAFNAGELVIQDPKAGIARNMPLDDIADQVGDVNFRYIF